MKLSSFPVLIATFMISCQSASNNEARTDSSQVRLMTIDPGHFHAALVQKSMYPNVDSNVFVYAPDGPDLKLHLDRINAYNSRAENPTHWKEEVYTGADFFEKMLQEKRETSLYSQGITRRKRSILKNVLTKDCMSLLTNQW